MNQANMKARQKQAVDVLNSTLFMIEMEMRHYEDNRNDAWKHKKFLTPT